MAREGDISLNMVIDDRDFTVTIKNTNRLLSELRGTLDKTAGRADNTSNHFNSFFTRLRHGVMALASVRYLMIDLHDIFIRLPAAIIKSSGEVERMTKLMEGLSKQTTDFAKKQGAISDTKFVFNLAQSAPFEVKALADSFVKLKTAGLDPTNGSLQILVDSVAKFGGSSEHLHRASIAIQQMVGKGVISMEELRQQLGEAVPDAMQAMAVGTGMSMGELVKAISKGTVEARSALERMFAVMKVDNQGKALAMMDTYVGQLEKLKTNWTLFANEVGNSGGFFQEIKAQLVSMNGAFSNKEVKQFASDISFVMADIVRGLADAARFVVKYSGEIANASKVILAFWVGSKLVSYFKAATTAFAAFKATYITGSMALIAEERKRAMISAAQTNLMARESLKIRRAQITAEALMNANKIREDAKNAGIELAQNRAKYAALMAEGDAYRLQYAAAHAKSSAAHMVQLQSGLYREIATGKLVAARTVETNRMMATAYFERAMAAERMAMRIKAAEAGLLATSTGVHGALRANTERTKLAYQGLGTVTQVMAAKVSASMVIIKTAMTGLVAALGGPFGAILTLLSVGALAWYSWGNSAREAAQQVIDASRAARDGVASLESAQALSLETSRLQLDIAKQTEVVEKARKSNTATAGTNASYREAVVREEVALKALQSRLTKARADFDKAHEQGKAADISRTVGLVGGQIERATNKQLNDVANAFAKQKESLEKLYAEKKISEMQKTKRLAELYETETRARAKIEIAALKNQAATVTSEIRKIEAGKYKGRNIDRDHQLEASKAQLKSVNDALAQKEAALLTGVKIGTAPEFVSSKGKGDGAAKLTSFEKSMESLREKIAGVNAELDKEGTGTVARMMEGYRSDFTNKKINSGELKQLETEVDKYRGLKVALASQTDAGALRKTAEDAFIGLSEKAEDGSASLEKIRLNLLKLMETERDFDAQAQLRSGYNFIVKAGSIFNSEKEKKDRLDSEKAAEDYAHKIGEINQSMITDRRLSLNAQYEEEVRNAAKTFELRIEKEKLTGENLKLESEKFAEWVTTRYARLGFDLKSPLENLADEWADITDEMEQATTKWADGMVDTMVNFAKTGKMEWKSLLTSMLADILKMQTQKALSGMIGGFMGGIGKAATGVINGGTQQIGGTGGKEEQGPLSGILNAAGAGFKKLMGSLFGTSEAADKVAASTGDQTAQIISGITQNGLKLTAEQAAASAVANLAVSANSAAFALSQIGGGGGSSALLSGLGGALSGMFGGGGATGSIASPDFANAGEFVGGMGEVDWFADGGIMTGAGSVPLRKYAMGGVANFPQAAIFGEGSMPEAYVPLPDGRSIPVTISGAGGQGAVPSVTVNVINQTQQQVNAKQGQMRFDGKQMILDVVLSAASQPGSFREGMKGAMA